AGVLELLDADRHHEVVGAAGDGVGRIAERLAARGAHVLEAGDGLVRYLERFGEHEPPDAPPHPPQPVRVDPMRVDSGGAMGFRRGIDEQILRPLVPVLAERRAAHADDGDAVLDTVASHGFPSGTRYTAARGPDATWRRPADRTLLEPVAACRQSAIARLNGSSSGSP